MGLMEFFRKRLPSVDGKPHNLAVSLPVAAADQRSSVIDIFSAVIAGDTKLQIAERFYDMVFISIQPPDQRESRLQEVVKLMGLPPAEQGLAASFATACYKPTNLTPEQARVHLLYSNKVVFAQSSDGAGAALVWQGLFANVCVQRVPFVPKDQTPLEIATSIARSPNLVL